MILSTSMACPTVIEEVSLGHGQVLECGGRRKRKTSNSYEIKAATMSVLKTLRRGMNSLTIFTDVHFW